MSNANFPELENPEVPQPVWRRRQVIDVATTRLDMTWNEMEDLTSEHLNSRVQQNEQDAVNYIQAIQPQPESKIGAPVVENTVNDPDVARSNVALAFPQRQVDPMKDHYHNSQPLVDPREYHSVN